MHRPLMWHLRLLCLTPAGHNTQGHPGLSAQPRSAVLLAALAVGGGVVLRQLPLQLGVLGQQAVVLLVHALHAPHMLPVRRTHTGWLHTLLLLPLHSECMNRNAVWMSARADHCSSLPRERTKQQRVQFKL
jgi:hypothetical protein